MSKITDLDATGQAELVKKGEASPLELTEAAIEAAERLDPQLGVMLDKEYDYAREQARTVSTDTLFPGVPMLF
jgi:amidase